MPTRSSAAFACGRSRSPRLLPGGQGRVRDRRFERRSSRMTVKEQALKRPPPGQALAAHHAKAGNLTLRDLSAADATRGERLTAEAVGLYLDYSKNRVTDETLALLLALAEECNLRARIEAMFRGEKINVTERRAVLHVALRAPRGASI